MRRTPHLFASSFFRMLSRFFACVVGGEELKVHVGHLVQHWQPSVGPSASPVKVGYRPPPSAASGLDRACRPAFVCCHSSTGRGGRWPNLLRGRGAFSCQLRG